MKSDKLHRIPGGFSLPSWLLRDVDATQVCSLSIETLIIVGGNQNASPNGCCVVILENIELCWFTVVN